MFRKVWTNLVVAAAAIFLVSLSPADAQNSRVIETVGLGGAQQVASALTTSPAPRSNFALAQAQVAGPERRIALVIGNSNYEAAKALPNPTNDAKAVSQLFNQAGFEVVMAFDLSRDLLRQVVGEFAEKVKEKGPNTVALVYYAGHGLQVDGDNYLVPVDAKFEKEADVADQGVRLADLMATLEAVPSKTRIVILDACRNNPFSALNEVAGKGLAIVDAPAGTIVAYSTAPGTEAFDGQGTHSPYAAAFMRTVKTPNLPIEQLFKKVRVLVDDVTGSKQMPWESSSLTSDFVFFTNANVEVAATPVAPKVQVAELRTRSVAQAYEVVVAEDSVEYYEEFVRIYPTHPLCDFIRNKLSRRLQMIAWHKATKSNNAQAYQQFLSKHANSDLAKAAQKLQEKPKVVSVFPKIDIKVGNGNGLGIKTGPVIPFPKNGNGNTGIGGGIKTGPIVNPQTGIGKNGNTGIGGGIKTGPIVNPQTGIGKNGNTGIGGGIKTGPIVNPQTGNAQNGAGTVIKPGTVIAPNGNTGIAGGIKPGTVITPNGTTGVGIKTGNVIPVTPQNGNTGIAGGIKTGPAAPTGKVLTLPNGNTGIAGGIRRNGQVATLPSASNAGKVIPQVNSKPILSNPQITTRPVIVNRPVINNSQINVQRQINVAPRVIQSQPRITTSQPVFRNNGGGNGGGGLSSFRRR